jgi:GTP-binding protein Era
MNDFVSTAFQDADVMLFLTEPGEPFEDDDPILQRLDRLEAPLMVGINKADRHEQAAVQAAVERWQTRFPNAEIYPLSALEGFGVPALLERMKEHLPEHPAYFPKDQWTDRPERFFVTEIIREKILRHYKQEIPYSVEVVVESFREADTIIRIGSVIYVNRASQKPILIGHQGRSIKRVGVEARQDMEAFFGKQVHLELFVKVREGWRERDRDLKQFGYEG